MGVGKAILLLIAWSCFADPHVALEQCVQHEHVLNQHITSLSKHINTNNKKLGCRRQAARPHSSLLWRLLPKSSCLSEECKIRDFWLQAFSVDVLSGQIDAQIRREWIERVNARSAMNFSVDFLCCTLLSLVKIGCDLLFYRSSHWLKCKCKFVQMHL